MADLVEIRSALDAIDPKQLDFTAWLNAGFSLFENGAPCSAWEEWSRRDPDRFIEGECPKRWRTFKRGGGVNAEWLFKVAYSHGWKWRDRSGREFMTSGQGQAAFTMPVPPDLTPAQQAATQLKTLFSPDEHVCIVTKSELKPSGKYAPVGGVSKTVEEWLSLLDQAHDLRDALGYDTNAGAWLCCNPTNGKGRKNADISAYRFALVESDSLPIEEQVRLISSLGVPVSTLTESGGKSVHALVRVDAEGPEHYAERVGALFDACAAVGLKVDKACKNPARLTRLAGAARGGSAQRLMQFDQGAGGFASWLSSQREARKDDADADADDLPPFGEIDLQNLPPLAPELIHGLLRKGHSMTLTADSKAGKTWALIQLGLALACGGEWFGFPCERVRTLYVDFELDPSSFYRRVAWVADALGYDREAVREYFVPWNLRGHAAPLDTLREQIARRMDGGGFGAVILDPVYLLLDGDENAAGDVRGFVRSTAWLGKEVGNASIIVAHHHAKGYAADRKAIDRGSGSGVFARYPDALIDLVELRPSEAWMQAHPELAERFEQSEGTLTAWRAECTTREFRSPDFDLWFEVPVHRRDDSGFLAELSPATSAQIGGRKSGEQSRRKQADRDAELQALLPSLLKAHPDGIPLSVVAQADGRTQRRVKDAIDRIEGWSRVSTNNTCVVVPELLT